MNRGNHPLRESDRGARPLAIEGARQRNKRDWTLRLTVWKGGLIPRLDNRTRPTYSPSWQSFDVRGPTPGPPADYHTPASCREQAGSALYACVTTAIRPGDHFRSGLGGGRHERADRCRRRGRAPIKVIQSGDGWQNREIMLCVNRTEGRPFDRQGARQGNKWDWTFVARYGNGPPDSGERVTAGDYPPSS